MATPKVQPVVHPFDRQFGTDTGGLIPGYVISRGTNARVDELTAYYGIAPSILRTALDLWLTRTEPQNEIEETVFVDVGAGKGRAMLVASQFPFKRVEGIELSPTLARIAQENIAKFEQHPDNDELSPLMLVEADATTHPLPGAPTLAFLFHPFELPVLQRFIAHVEQALARDPHSFDLFYINTEHDAWLDRHKSFERVWFGKIPMSTEDHVADLAEIAQQKEYGSTGDELCAIYRYVGPAAGTSSPAAAKQKKASTKPAGRKLAKKKPAKKAAAKVPAAKVSAATTAASRKAAAGPAATKVAAKKAAAKKLAEKKPIAKKALSKKKAAKKAVPGRSTVASKASRARRSSRRG